MKELIAKRQPRSKIFRRPDGKYHLRIRRRPIHFRNRNGVLQDIDLNSTMNKGDYLIDQCPYNLRVKPDRAMYSYKGSRGYVIVELTHINDNLVARKKSNQEKHVFVWKNISLDTDYSIIPKPNGVATFLTLHSENAPKKWTWKITGDDIVNPIVGFDAMGRHCNIKISREGNLLIAEWDGTVRSRTSLRTGEKISTVYPVRIDPTVNEEVVAGADDALSFILNGTTPYLFNNSVSTMTGGVITGGPYYLEVHQGLRFQTIGVPQGANIDSATITIAITDIEGSPILKFYADDVDDAVAWSALGDIDGITKTSAGVTISPSATGAYSFSVQSIVQEIINRGGWSSGNDIRFGGFNQQPLTAINGLVIAAYEHTTEDEAQLDIVYTVAEGGDDEQAAVLVGV